MQLRSPLVAMQRLLESRTPLELHAFAALTHMLSDKLPQQYAQQLKVQGTDTVVALVAALGMPVRPCASLLALDSWYLGSGHNHPNVNAVILPC